MKKNKTMNVVNRMTLRVLLVSLVAFVAVSCEKDDLQMFGDNNGSEVSVNAMGNNGNNNQAPAPGDASIAGIAIDAGFEQLVGALVYVDTELGAGLVDLFSNGTGQFTVFAPTDEAFEGLYEFLGIDEINDLPAELVLDVLFYHVVEGRRAANSVVPPVRPRPIITLLGQSFSVNSSGVITDIAGQEVNIAAADISASNGIIHVIDKVLLPLKNDEENGENNGDNMIAAQPGNAGQGAPAPAAESIAGIAIGAGFTELVGALVYVDAELDAGLVDLFSEGTDQYTVFAPTNEAFEALYEALEINGITDLPAELVLDVLLYHVVQGRRAANSVVPPVRPRSINTLLDLNFTVDANGVIKTIAGQEVNIVAADISASNGIIHVVDAVLLPLD